MGFVVTNGAVSRFQTNGSVLHDTVTLCGCRQGGGYTCSPSMGGHCSIAALVSIAEPMSGPLDG